ncbi:MAG: S8 family serine peptidase [Verrucomicrobiota bacterium]|jgi:subtilisin-like proprotein convertase family protein
MRLKPRDWFLISLLLFAASFCVWQYAEKRAAQRHAAENIAAKARALKLQHPPLAKTLAANASAKGKSYRLSNTKQNIQQLLHNNHALILRNALIDTEAPVALNIPAHLRAKGAPGSYLVQADRPLDKAFYAELSQAGASYISYVPNNAVLVAASPEVATNLAATADVVAVLPYEPYYKLDSTLLPSAVEQQPQTNALSVTTFPGQRDAALAALTQLGATLIGEDRSPFGPTLVVNVPSGSLTAIAQLPLAQEIEAYMPRRLMNDLTRVIMGVATNTLIGTTNYLGLTGLNVTVNLNDTGVDSTHPDFLPTSRLVGDFPSSLTDTDGHGTHVAGIIAGNGSESDTVTSQIPGSIIPGADFRGKATNATLFVQALDLVAGPYVSDSFLQQNASVNLGPTNLISNNSWDYASSVYDMHAASFDAATRDAQPNVDGEQPLLFVFAAGNNGSGSDSGINGRANTILSPATAKNVITVGAIDSPRFITNEVTLDFQNTNEVWYGDTDNSNLVADFSSCGNVDIGIEGLYGRFKPDVVAPGMFTISCRAADYVDPTNQTVVTDYYYTNAVALNQTNYYQLPPLPDDTSALIVIISSNALSPSPFPTNMLLLADLTYPPTDVVSSNNFFNLTTYNPGDFWNFGVVAPPNSPGPVEYSINFYLYETNTQGDYFTVLSNMNYALRPYYVYQSGTSMSAGAVSGTLALMQEFLQSHSQLGVTNPSPALLKAMLINGSRSLGVAYNFLVNTETANEQGWGLPNLTNVIPSSLTNNPGSSTNTSMLLVDQSRTNALATGQYQTYTINCGDTNAAMAFPLRVTLVWTDPPGDPAAGVALVNNLDLTVADSAGNIYIGNDFLGGQTFTEVSSLTNLPGGQSDNAAQNVFVINGVATNTSAGDPINNVQNVYINPATAPIAFPLTITISGTRVNVNAVPGQTNNIAQDYALVVSSDDPALSNSLTVASSPIVNLAPVLVTVASNGVPLLHQRVGANEPNLYSYPNSTNGNASQWHFFIFTNNQFGIVNGTNIQATNVAFATFMPPNLSIPRNSSADIDLYVSTNVSPLTNLAAFVQSADTSLGRTGTETIIYTNSVVNEVYYIGVKSEDQQAADFGFYSVAQQTPFSSDVGGQIIATGTSLPVTIPNAVSIQPALVFAFLVNPNPLEQQIRRVTVVLGIQQQDPTELSGTLQFNGLNTVLNAFSGNPGGFTNTYDDLQEDPNTTVTTDGYSEGSPGLNQYVGQPMNGLWLLTEADNSLLAQPGAVNQYTVIVDPQPPLSGFFITLNSDEWFDDYIPVPNDATNLIISAIYENEGTNLAGDGPIGIYLTNVDILNLSDYGSNNILPPGGSLTLGTNNPVPGWPDAPPLSGGIWYYGIYNSGSAPVTLYVQVQIQESLTPNLVQNYTNSGVPVPLTTDAHTQTQICITNGQQVVSLQVGVRINDPNLDDLVLHLTSPEGTSVLLFEDRGGTSATNLGLTEVTTNGVTNYIYTVFTEDTNLATTPIKFAVPPFAREVDIPLSVLWSNSWETTNAGVYTNGQILEGWLVTNNVVTIQTTNGTGFLTNNEVGIVTDASGDQFVTTNAGNVLVTNSLGTNYLALTSGRIVQTFGATNPPFTSANGFAISNGQTYQIQFYAKPVGIIGWWPGDGNADDIINGNNGSEQNVSYMGGEVGEAFLCYGFSSYPYSQISIPDQPIFQQTNSLSIEGWINPAGANGSDGTILWRGDCRPGLDPYLLQMNGDNTLSFYVEDELYNTASTFTSTPLANSQWCHVAGTLDGNTGTMSVYTNGVLAAQTITTLRPFGALDPTQEPTIGIGNVGTPCWDYVPFNGGLDEISLYNRFLSPAEIYAIYHAGSLGKYSTNSVLPNFDLTIDGISTNNVILTNAWGGWQLFTNSFVANSDNVTIEFSGNPLGVLLDDIQIVQLPSTNYNNYYLPEEPLTPFVGQNPLGCWTLDVWDTRNDSPNPTDGTLLGWTLEVTTSSTNASLYVLTNDVPMTVTNTNGMTYFAVDVPPYATFATNILTVGSGGPLALWFDQNALPTGGLPGDVALLPGVTTATSPSAYVLATEGAPPPLVPGRRYFLGVQNNGSSSATFSIEVDFNGTTNAIIPLTNAIPFTNTVGTSGPEYYSFVVPPQATMVTFQILNPTGGEVDLYADDGLPLPGPLSFDYDSQNAGANDQFIVVTTNSVPVALPALSSNNVVPSSTNTWYLAAYNVAGTNTNTYTIIATWETATNGPAFKIYSLSNGVPQQIDLAPPGYPANFLFSFTVTNNPGGVQFTVTNTTGSGNVELLADFDVFPTPEEFYSGSFNAGIAPQLIQIGTNAELPSLEGVWYLAVPNTSSTPVSYLIEASTIVTGPVTNVPLFIGASISLRPGLFTMSWTATSGRTYEVEFSTNLTTWTFLTNITAQSATAAFTDPTPISGQRARYYRLMQASNAPLHPGGKIASLAGGFTLNWSANPGQTYEIDLSTNLTMWTFLANVTTPTNTGTYTDSTPVGNQRARYYRILP